MVARLTQEDWPDIDADVELCEDFASYRAFWRAVLLYAFADGGDAVYYRPSNDDECLAIEIDGARYELDPPPREFRRELFAAIRRLAAGGRLRQTLLQLRGSISRSTYRGEIMLATDDGDVAWEAHAFPNGISLRRVRGTA